MIDLHFSQQQACKALKRMIFRLISKDELNSENLDRLHFLASERGFCRDSLGELILDCQVEYCIE